MSETTATDDVIEFSHTFKKEYVVSFFKYNEGFIDVDTFLEGCIRRYRGESGAEHIVNEGATNISDLNDKIEITKNELNRMYKDYKLFIEKRETFVKTLRDFNRASQCILNQAKFPELLRLTSQYIDTDVPTFTCELCQTFSATTKKGVTTHMRKCRREHGNREADNTDEFIEDLQQSTE